MQETWQEVHLKTPPVEPFDVALKETEPERVSSDTAVPDLEKTGLLNDLATGHGGKAQGYWIRGQESRH